MDYSMPGLDGPSCVKAIRQFLAENTVGKHTQPFVCFVTAYQEKSFRDEASKAGMNSFIVKPIFKDNLHKVLIKSGLID